MKYLTSTLSISTVRTLKWFMLLIGVMFACLAITTQPAEAVVTPADFLPQPVSIRVSEVQSVDDQENVTSVRPGADGSYVLYQDRFIGFEPARALIGYYNQKVVIEFTGSTLPDALVTLNLDATKSRTHATYANGKGQWQIVIDTTDLPAGNYNATVYASLNDVVSDPQIIGTFAVYTENKLSNMTWIAIILAGLGIIIVLTIVNGVLLFRRD